MAKHYSIDDILLELDRRDERGRSSLFMDHLASCESCRRACEYVTRALEASDNSAIAPSNQVFNRVLATYRRHHPPHGMFALLKSFFIENRSYAYAAFAAAAVFIIITATLIIKTLDTNNSVPMGISYIEGDVYINNKIANLSSTIKLNSRIRVGKNSLIELFHNRAYRIKVLDDSIIVFEKGKYPGKMGQRVYTIKLLKGALLSKINRNKPNLLYTYATPEAHLKPLESEFILRSDEDETVVIMKSGSTNIKSLKSDEKVVTEPNKKYTITKSIDLDDADEEEMEEFDQYDYTKKSLMRLRLKDFCDGAVSQKT